MNGYVLHDFAKADSEWLDPLLTAIAEHAPLLAGGEDSSFMNRVHLALAEEEDGPEETPPAARNKASSLAGRAEGAFAGLKRLLGREH